MLVYLLTRYGSIAVNEKMWRSGTVERGVSFLMQGDLKHTGYDEERKEEGRCSGEGRG